VNQAIGLNFNDVRLKLYDFPEFITHKGLHIVYGMAAAQCVCTFDQIQYVAAGRLRHCRNVQFGCEIGG
jgi:hypothetical protein